MDENLICNTVPRHSLLIKKQLDDLARVKSVTEECKRDDFPSKIAIRSLLLHEQELLEELKAAEMIESESDFEIILDGQPVKEHSIEAGFLGNILRIVQELLFSISQVAINAPTLRGAFPSHIIELNKLFVSPAFIPSSFGIRFRIPTEKELDRPLLETTYSNLDKLCEILNESMPKEELFDYLSQGRVRSKYKELLDLISKQGASTRWRTKKYPYGVKLGSSEARVKLEWLQQLNMKEQSYVIVGMLTGGSIELYKFEIVSEENRYYGICSEESSIQMKNIKFGQMVQATVREKIVQHEEYINEPRITHYLEKVELYNPGDKTL